MGNSNLTCKIDTCTKPAKNAGCCWGHYQQLRTHGKIVSKRIREKHFQTNQPEYSTWLHMKDRCHNANSESYYLYGARGISVCDRWRNDFAAFLKDMGIKPSNDHTIERVNNDGNYEPGNCVWATMAEQAQNKRGVTSVTFNGKTQSLAAWARELGLSKAALYVRVQRMPIAKALSLPPQLPKGSVVNTSSEKYCARCDRLLPRSDFSSNRSAGDGLGSMCKRCDNARRKRA